MKREEWNRYYRSYGPDGIPHYPDWPNQPHADWPHWRGYQWNDTEPAMEVPWDVNCCRPDDSDCICVTSGDAERWNSYSALSGLTAFDPDMIASAVSAYKDLPDLEHYEDLLFDVSANSGIWNSAGYVPNIYENLSAMCNAINEKVDLSAVSSFHVWTDSQKFAWEQGIPGDYSGTLYGDGTFDRPLRVHKNIAIASMLVAEATDNYQLPLVKTEDVDNIVSSVNVLNTKIETNATNIQRNTELIEMLLNGYTPTGTDLAWKHQEVTLEESKRTPRIMYYWTSVES